MNSRRLRASMMTPAGILRLVGLIFILIGAIFTLAGAGFGVESWLYINNAESTVGTVTQSGRNITVQFQTTSGQTVEATTGMRTNPPMAQMGEVVKLYYRADNPSDMRLNNFVNLWLLPTIFGAIGISFLIIGAGLAIGGMVMGGRKSAAATAQ